MNYIDLAPLVAIDALGAPNPVIVAKLAEAANEFYRLTRAYEVEQTPAALVANQQTLTLSIPAGTALLEVNEVKLGARDIKPPLNLTPNGEWQLMTGTPSNFLVTADRAALRWIPYPVTAEPTLCYVKFSVEPLLTATSVPDAVGNPYQDALIAGAKALVLTMVDKPWSNPAASVPFETKFLKRINETRLAVARGGARDVQHVVSKRRL